MADALEAYLQAGETTLNNAVLAHYASSGLTPQEFIVYLFLTQWAQHHREAPALDALAQRVRLSAGDTYNVITSLIRKKAIRLISQPDAQGKTVDRYDVSPLLRQSLPQHGADEAPTAATPASDTGASVFGAIEVEFGRPLSPIEQQTIHDWLHTDHYDPALIKLALREAVLNQAYSLRYMDRILLNWEKRHLTTVQQVQEAQAKRNEL